MENRYGNKVNSDTLYFGGEGGGSNVTADDEYSH